jgi:hypothetical protein
MTRVYESNGPDVKVRGTAHHIAEKYMQLARDAQSSGDPVAAESYLQHAEHYYRLIAAAQAQFQQQNPHHQQNPQQQFQRPDQPGDEFEDDMGDEEQPEFAQHPGAPNAPQPHYQPQQPQQPQQFRQPQHQPQPNYQPQPRDPGLPAFITGGAPAPQAPGQGPGNGYDPEQGDRDNRFRGRHRRRFRPHGQREFEPRSDRPNEAPHQSAPSEQPAGEVTPPKPQGE